MKLKFLSCIKVFGVAVTAVVLLLSCNKDVPAPTPNSIPQTIGQTFTPPVANGQTINAVINSDASFTILKAAVVKAGLTALLSDSLAVFTFFAPTDAAFQASGIPSAAALAAFRAGQLDTLLRYHFVGGQVYSSSMISTTFPNLYLPSMFVLQAPSAAVPPGLRMPIFPSKRGSILWVNNIPIVQADIFVSNGVVHKTATLVSPPSQFLWDRINADANLAYFKAAIQRADNGVAAGQRFQDYLVNPAANFTVFAPTNIAFQQILTAQIAGALIAQGATPAAAQQQAAALASSPTVFTNPAVAGVLTQQTVQGLVAYHILGVRSFTVNIPTTLLTNVPTLLNSSVPTVPGLSLQASFNGPSVTAATVKGFANSTPSNIQINPTPAPNGTSDQHYINGVLHIIDQVLRPQ